MKKLVKIVAVMAILSTVFMGCKNPAGDENTPGTNRTDSDTPSTETPETPETPDDEETDEITPFTVDLSKAEHILVDWAKGWGEATNKMEFTSEKLVISCGNGWANTVEIPINKDLSKYTKVSVKGFVDAEWTEDGSIKFELYSSDTTASELSKDYGDKTFMNFTSESATTTIAFESAGQLYGDNFTAKADLSNITKIKINPQGCSGILTLESIVFSE